MHQRPHRAGPLERRTLMERLGAAIAARGDGPPPALLVAGADAFEDVAIELGDHAAEDLIEALGKRLQATIEPGDSIARVGDDRFAIICAGGELEAVRRAESLQQALVSPFQTGERRVVLSLSVGIAASAATTAEALLRDARIALRRARKRGGGCHELHSPELAARARRRLAIEDELRLALERGEFELYYQPLLALPDGTVAGLEALLRWNHPRRGLVGPGEFLPVAEESGLIAEIGRWALREACRQSARWSADPTLQEAFVSVNVSGRQLAAPGFDEDVRACLAQTGVPAERLVLELTETVLMQDADAPARTLRRLRELGVRVALDDFGTGYSSLAYLRSFPIQMLKVDRSFVAELAESATAGHIMSAVAQLASTLGLSMVAEGVETPAQLAQLLELGCPVAQGYLFSRPVPADAAERLLRDGLGTDVLAVLRSSCGLGAAAAAPPTAAGGDGAGGEPLLTLSEACEALGVSVNTLRRWADSGRIDCVRTDGGHRRFPARAIQKINRERGHQPAVRPASPPTGPIPSAAAALEEVAGDALTRAIGSLYAGTRPGWMASPHAAACLDEWCSALSDTCSSGDPGALERATDRLVREAVLGGTTVLERDLLLERLFELLLRALAARGAAADDLRQLRRLARSVRQRALALAEPG